MMQIKDRYSNTMLTNFVFFCNTCLYCILTKKNAPCLLCSNNVVLKIPIYVFIHKLNARQWLLVTLSGISATLPSLFWSRRLLIGSYVSWAPVPTEIRFSHFLSLLLSVGCLSYMCVILTLCISKIPFALYKVNTVVVSA